MTRADEAELDRLSEELRGLDEGLSPDSRAREALQKAGLALMLTFLHGHRAQLEDWYQRLDSPITEAERAHLRRLGIDPDQRS